MNVPDELRALAVQDAPERAAVERLFAAAASLLKEEPRQAPSILRKSLPLVMHAHAHVARGAADGVLKLLDIVAALPDHVVDDAMPVLAQLLDFSIGKWSFSQSTYRFARFPPLRARILEAALAMAVAERNHASPAVAVMALHDVIDGLQKCNAFDEPQVTDAFARYALGQSNAHVQRAVVAYLLEHAPHVVARVLDSRIELFPSVEDLHVYRGEQRGHLVDLAPHDARVAGLAHLPIAHLERLLFDDEAEPGRRMAAALAVPLLRDHARFLPALRRMLDVDATHVGVVEGQAQPETFHARAVALVPFTQLLQDGSDARNAALALDAFRVVLPHPVPIPVLASLARACDRGAVSAWLAAVAAAGERDGNGEDEGRWTAFEVLCGLVDDVTAAADALARDIVVCTPGARGVVRGLHARFPAILELRGPAPFASLLQAWPATMAHKDVAHPLRLAGYAALQKSAHAHAHAMASALQEAKRVLLETAKTDKPLAEALLIVPP